MLIVQFVRSTETYMYSRGLSTASKLAMVWGPKPNGYCVPIVQAILILMLYVDKARPRLISPVAYALINPTCSDRILTCRIKSICSPAKGGTGCYRFNYQPGS